MSKPLLYYCNSCVDEPVFRSIEGCLETMSRGSKLELAHLTLSLCLQDSGESVDVFLEFKKAQLVKELSPQGRLELAQALITQVKES